MSNDGCCLFFCNIGMMRLTSAAIVYSFEAESDMICKGSIFSSSLLLFARTKWEKHIQPMIFFYFESGGYIQ